MNTRKWTMILLMITAVQLSAVAEEAGRIHSVTTFGFDPVSRYNNIVAGYGISLGQELFVCTGKTLMIGAGFKYLLPREMPGGGQLSWLPFYASAKLFVPAGDLPLYLKGSLGYTLIRGNNSYMAGREDLEGGLYYLLGGGINLPFYYSESIRYSFVFDMGYASYSGKVETSGIDESLSYMTMDLAAGLGMRF